MAPAPKSLLDPDRTVIALIDHQPQMFLAGNSDDAGAVLNNTVALAKAARLFGVPVVLTSIGSYFSGELDPTLRAVLPETRPIERSWINAWEDDAFRDAVLATNREQIVLAGLWTEACLLMPVLSAREEGHDVRFVVDASMGASKATHDAAVSRMIQAGAAPMTSLQVMYEFQRDFARQETYPGFNDIVLEHAGAFAQSVRYYRSHVLTDDKQPATA